MMLLEHPYSPTLPGFTGRLNGVPSAVRVMTEIESEPEDIAESFLVNPV